jgi:hypothetical protein
MRSKKSIARNRSTRIGKVMRHKRVKSIMRLPLAARIAIMAILVIGVGAMVMALAGSRHSSASSARADMPATEQSPTAPAKNSAAPLPTIPDIVPAVNSSPEDPTAGAAAKQAAITITGCLERDDETFRLKDTDGADAPKSRSWKTGFLKKSSASVQVVDASHQLKLPTHVGQRVSVTGTLVNKEMQVRSLTRISPSCSSNTRVKI